MGTLCFPLRPRWIHTPDVSSRQTSGERRLAAIAKRHSAYPLPTWDDNDVREALVSVWKLQE